MAAQSKAPRRKPAKKAMYDRALLLALYGKMVLLRRFETLAQAACRKGETPGFFHLYIGEEATAVGVCANLRTSDWITSTHRGHGHALAKGMDPKILMAELFGKAEGCCGGRGGTMHLYDRSTGLFGTNGIVAAGIGHAVGAGISARVQGRDDIGVAFFGDGAINHGGFHEATNFAGIQRAPVVLICENNLYATATPLVDATLNPEIATKAAAYGIPGIAVDGNDVLEVMRVAGEAVARARAGEGPTLIEAKTYRTVGHHEGDPVTGTYRTQDEVDEWLKRDPIALFRRRLVKEFGIDARADLDPIDARVEAEANEALAFARQGAEPDPATVARHVYAEPINPPEALRPATNGGAVQQSWLDAVRDGLAEEMRRNPHILYFGEGTGERGGTFAHTKNLYEEFGAARMVDTPISEQGFTGAALGASATGTRTIADLMFADFMFEAAGQIVLQAAKLRYMSNGQMNAPLVIRVGMGAVRSAGPHHSGAYYPMWAHVPGLIVCVPSNPADAKGLMKTALRASDPVLMMEPKALFASKGEVPLGDHLVPFGVARIARSGSDLTIATAGQLVQHALQAAEVLAAEGIEAEVIDLRTIMPLDVATVAGSIAKTHRLLVVDEAWAMCGVGAELAQAMNEIAYDDLDAPVARLHTGAMTHPLAPALERAMLVDRDGIVAAARGLMEGKAPVPRHWHFAGAAAPSVEAPLPVAAPQSPAVPKPTLTREPGPPQASSPQASGEPITMPFGDLTISEGKIVRWAKADGELVESGELVAEIETDKSVVEIEAPAAGRLTIELQPGTVVPMGGRIGVVGPG